jgi:methionyl-tRNA synthetase
MSKDPYYITTAISYVNGKPHLGHAYEIILTDVMARFKRLDGHDVYFLTGTDEHGQKVAKTADDNNMDVKAFADQNADFFRQMTKTLNITNDDFIRTTEPRHYKSAQALWEKLKEKGDIYLDKYEGWYSVREEAYFGEEELIIGDRGEKLSPNGTEVQWVEEGSYFFKLSSYTDKLLKYYEENPNFIQPDSRRNEVISFVRGGLNDLSVSRLAERLHWGIPVPDDELHVMYVWLDALTNYITGIGYPDVNSDSYKKFWPADVHVIGKDITRFHAVYWPAFLMSADLPLPKQIFAHGFINVAGEKMSKSIGNVLSPDDLVENFSLDGMRYVLMRDMPHGQDGNFTDAHAIQRINADLANGLGNLAQRTFSMIFKNCDGALPEPCEFNGVDEALLNKAYVDILPKLRGHAETFAFHRALEDLAELVSECDSYVDMQAPWTLKKTDPDRMKTVLYVLAEMVRMLAILYQPYTPNAMETLLSYLDIQDRDFNAVTPNNALKPGMAINKPEGVFPRITLEEAA